MEAEDWASQREAITWIYKKSWVSLLLFTTPILPDAYRRQNITFVSSISFPPIWWWNFENFASVAVNKFWKFLFWLLFSEGRSTPCDTSQVPCHQLAGPEPEDALIVPGAGQWLKMSPCPPHSLATPPPSGIIPFWSVMVSRVGRKAQLCATFFHSSPSSLTGAHDSCYTTHSGQFPLIYFIF